MVIPANPQRVVAADSVTLPAMLDLGVVPIAAGAGGSDAETDDSFHPGLYALGADKVQPISRFEPSLEQIAELDPDLIIATDIHVGLLTDGVDTYGGLAPVVVIDSGGESSFETLRNIGRVLGQEERAEQLIAETEQAMRARAQKVEVDVISFIAPAVGPAEVYVFITAANPFIGFLADLLDFETAPGPEDAMMDGGYALMSFELLAEATQGAEAIIVFGTPEESEAKLLSNALWAMLPAVQAGKFYYTGSNSRLGGEAGIVALREEAIGIADFLASVETK